MVDLSLCALKTRATHLRSLRLLIVLLILHAWKIIELMMRRSVSSRELDLRGWYRYLTYHLIRGHLLMLLTLLLIDSSSTLHKNLHVVLSTLIGKSINADESQSIIGCSATEAILILRVSASNIAILLTILKSGWLLRWQLAALVLLVAYNLRLSALKSRGKDLVT